MKNIIFILSLISLFFISNVDLSAQKRAYDIAINANQDPDSTYLMLSETANIKYKKGKGKFVNYANWKEALVDSIRAEISDSIAASGGGLPYLVYTALLTQSNTAAPVATVLQNTLGGTVVWTYNNAGNYSATLSGAFLIEKTALFATPEGYAGNYVLLNFGRADNNTVVLQSLDDQFAGINWDDDGVGRVTVEIRVYP